MSYQVLARKLRPKQFQDVIGQDHVIRSFINALKSGNIAHAYLLTGTRGIGKTTIARIFAKALRCEQRLPDGNPCNQCKGCLDFSANSSLNFVEIDGASNNGVDQIRELITETNYAPSFGKYKIYLIDEVHMVTQQAFNALLKTLEEPPPYIIFLFATTEAHKLPGTVLSRCQRFDFRQVSLDDLNQYIKSVAQKESIHFSSPALINEICKQGNGSVRDTLSFLDQVLSYTPDRKISEDVVVTSLGIAKLSAIRDLAANLLNGDEKQAASIYRQIIKENISPKNIVNSLLDLIYSLIEMIDDAEQIERQFGISKQILNDISAAEMYWLYENLAKDSEWGLRSIAPDKVMEVMLRKLALRRNFLSSPAVEKKKIIVSPTTVLKKEFVASVPTDVVAPEITQEIVTPKISTENVAEIKIQKDWQSFLTNLEKSFPVMSANLEQGNIVHFYFKENSALEIKYGFKKSAQVFYDHLSQQDVKEKLINAIIGYFGIDRSKLFFEMNLVHETDNKFSTVAEEKDKMHDQHLKKTEDEIRSHPMIKKAEELFNSKIDKVIINKR